MEGCCRHYQFAKEELPTYKVIAVDSSQKMLNYGKLYNKVPAANLFCSTVQDFAFHRWNGKISLCVCWWNMCYLDEKDIKEYIFSMMLTLRCPKNNDSFASVVTHSGYIIIAEPTGTEFSINNYNGQSMVIRPACFYDKLFDSLGLDIIRFKDYPSYGANDQTEISQERVWLLRENPESSSVSPDYKKPLVQSIQKEDGSYSLKFWNEQLSALDLKE